MSELNEAPISPQEAAAYLAGQQDALKDEALPVSDGDNLFGARGVNASQDYKEMSNLAHDVKREPAELEPDAATRAIAEKRDEIERYRESTTHDIERDYFINNDPSRRTPSNQVVSAEQAASDITLARQQEAAELDRLESEQLAQAIEQLRAGDQQPAQEVAHGQSSEAPQVQRPEQQSQSDDPLARALSDPAVLNAVQQEVAKAHQQADQIAHYYRQAIAQNAQAAAATLTIQFPELQGLQSEDQYRAALQAMSIYNPQRAQTAVKLIEATRQVIGEQQKAAAAHSQAEQQRARLYFDHAARASDDLFSTWAKENLPGQEEAVRAEALAMLREEMSEEQINWQWHNNAMFRSFPAQKALAEACLYRISKRGLAEKKSNPVPVVQRPGSPLQREPEGDYRQRQLSSRLDGATGRDALRIAAEMVTARRNARR